MIRTAQELLLKLEQAFPNNADRHHALTCCAGGVLRCHVWKGEQHLDFILHENDLDKDAQSLFEEIRVLADNA